MDIIFKTGVRIRVIEGTFRSFGKDFGGLRRAASVEQIGAQLTPDSSRVPFIFLYLLFFFPTVASTSPNEATCVTPDDCAATGCRRLGRRR
jgi:hypothetical protein